jgi:spore coat protein H
MDLYHRNYIPFLLLLPLIFPRVQFETEPVDNKLDLTDTTRIIENRIQINISKGAYREIKEISGRKVFLKKPVIVVNTDPVDKGQIHTRGKTTLHLRRKSFSFDLEEKVRLRYSGEDMEFKKFYAISLSMDKHYFRNRISFEMLKILGLFDLFYTYSEIVINDQSEGVYLLLERPQDWALKKNQSPFIIRRGFDNRIDKMRTGKKIEKSETQNHKQQFRQIYNSINKYDGEELYYVLSQWIDLDMYMKWLAFNFFIRNGDYTDEVYFYVEPVTGKYKIIPWDYDDIFARQPHEGTEEKLRSVGQKLVFSSEDKLDKKIASDPYLYQVYLIHLSEVLKELTPERIKNALENAYAELYPYYSTDQIIRMSQYDAEIKVSVESLKNELRGILYGMTQQRSNCLKYLN